MIVYIKVFRIGFIICKCMLSILFLILRVNEEFDRLEYIDLEGNI